MHIYDNYKYIKGQRLVSLSRKDFGNEDIEHKYNICPDKYKEIFRKIILNNPFGKEHKFDKRDKEMYNSSLNLISILNVYEEDETKIKNIISWTTEAVNKQKNITNMSNNILLRHLIENKYIDFDVIFNYIKFEHIDYPIFNIIEKIATSEDDNKFDKLFYVAHTFYIRQKVLLGNLIIEVK